MAFEIWDSPDRKIRFCFSHSDKNFTTGVMILQPGTQLPKHNRPGAEENLLQLSGKCHMTVFNADNSSSETVLEPGNSLPMNKGQWHIHANPFETESLTLFKAVGDITDVMNQLRQIFTKIEPGT